MKLVTTSTLDSGWTKTKTNLEIILTQIEVVMLLWQLESVLGDPRNLLLKFGQNWVRNSSDSANIEFVLWLVGGWV